MFKTTEKHKKYWAERKIDWNASYLSTWDHPHRILIVAVLKTLNWFSLWEVGCGPGANLVKITKEIPGRQLGGSDVNADAIALAEKTFVGGRFKVESSENLLMSDNSIDCVLSDASLIYIGPTKIQTVLKEMNRVGRNNIVLCEFHGKSWLKRKWLWWRTGYFAYDYEKELKEAGCYDIRIFKIPTQFWSGTPWEKWGYIITARVTKTI